MQRKLSMAPRKSIDPQRAKFNNPSERSDEDKEPPIDENAQPGTDTSRSGEPASETSGLSDWVSKRDADQARASNDPPL